LADMCLQYRDFYHSATRSALFCDMVMLSPLLSWLINNGISACLVRACTVFPLISILCCSAVVSFIFIAILVSLVRTFAFWVGRPICRRSTLTEIEHEYNSYPLTR